MNAALLIGSIAVALIAPLPSPVLATSARDTADAITALQRAAGAPVVTARARATGLLSYLGARRGQGVTINVGATARADQRARAFLSTYGRAFGIEATAELDVMRAEGPDAVGIEHVRLRQLHQGIPVTAGELAVHLRGNLVTAVNAETLALAPDFSTAPSVSAAAAAQRVRELLVRDLRVHDVSLSTPRLEVFNRGLLDGGRHPTRLAWAVEGTALPRREAVWIDALDGSVLLHVNLTPDALNREIYDAMDTAAIPGTLVRNEGGAPTGDADADAVYDFTGDTYAYYLSEHGRDGFDGAGATMVATVHSCAAFCGCPCFNAFWIGTQTIFGLLLSDDIVGHEWTHGITQYSAALMYLDQSGALNESYSDIFGETIDQLNGTGLDTPGAKWWIFEDFAGTPSGIRYMMDPTVQSDPGKLSDSQVFCGSADNGGVHTNSGINNHAYALMVDGGTYNGFTITGIGLTKAGKIMYRALTQYLTSAASFADNYNAINQACTDLVGVAGINSADCDEVQEALDAVEMSATWPCSCGNGVADPGEACDDGNQLNGDCCTSTCQLIPNGTSCDDGFACTVIDECSNGQCVGTNSCALDHFKCYQGRDLKNPPFATQLVDTMDQIVADEPLEIRKLKYVCVPVDKNGEAISNPSAHLACYQVKGASFAVPPQVEVSTQFQMSRFALKKPKLLCLPATKIVLP